MNTNTKAISIRGTITECTGIAPPICTKVVYQKVRPGLGNLPGYPALDMQRRSHVIPSDPKTPAQLARRARLALAVAAWASLDPAAKEQWHKLGKNRRLPGYQMFISAYMRA